MNDKLNSRKVQFLPEKNTVGKLTDIDTIDKIKVRAAAKFIRLLFSGVYPGPKNYDEIKKNTIVIKEIDYGSNIENGVMDINMPIDNLNNNKPLIVLLHGGGFIGGSKEATAAYARTLSYYGYIVANIEYAFAPEYTYPTQIIQVSKAIEYLKDNREKFYIDIDNIFIAGGSAGAQIASQIAAIQTNDKLANIMDIKPVLSRKELKGVILFCGLYNMDNVLETGFPGVKEYLWAYTGEKNFENYERLDEISTVKQITEDYPATFITAGDRDQLESQSIELLKVLNEKNIDCTSIFFKDKKLLHQYQFMLWTDEGINTLERVVSFIEDKINK